MTATCNTNTSCNTGFPGSFEVNGNFVMNEGSTLHLNMCCDDDNNGSGSSDKFLTSGTINTAGHLILTMNDNTTIDCGLLPSSGNPVVSALVNGSGELVLTLQDGSQINAGVVFNGTSNPVVSATINASNELVLTLQDGTEINAGAIAGTSQSNGFIVSDEIMSTGTVVEKTLSKTQTTYDLQAYALKKETAGPTTSETVTASPDSTQSVDRTQYLTATERGISSETSPSGSNIVQPMSSSSEHGQVASSYPASLADWPPYKAFGHDDYGFFMSGAPLAADGSDPHWIQISFNEQKTIAAYRVSGRTDSINDKVIRFKLQGSNDDVNWIDIDDQSQADVTYDVDNENWTDIMSVPTSTYTHFRLLLLATNPTGQTYPAVRELELLSSDDFTVTQYYNEFTPEFSNSMTIQATDSATSNPKKILLETGDAGNLKYYALDSGSGALTETSFNAVADIESNGFTPSGALDVSSLAPGFRILTLADEVTATSTVTGYVSEPASLLDMASYEPLTSVQITAPANTTVSVQATLGSYVRWNGSSWVAITSVASGNTATELNALTAASWAVLGGSSIGFGYFNSAETVATASALLGFGSGGSGSSDAWMLCDASEVRIRWYDSKVTFTAAQDGNYKLAYQDAA